MSSGHLVRRVAHPMLSTQTTAGCKKFRRPGPFLNRIHGAQPDPCPAPTVALPSHEPARGARRCGALLSGLTAGFERESASCCSASHASSWSRRYITRPPVPMRKLGGPCRLWRQTYKVFIEMPRYVAVFSTFKNAASTGWRFWWIIASPMWSPPRQRARGHGASAMLRALRGWRDHGPENSRFGLAATKW
jgi:hypothetical protein